MENLYYQLELSHESIYLAMRSQQLLVKGEALSERSVRMQTPNTRQQDVTNNNVHI